MSPNENNNNNNNNNNNSKISGRLKNSIFQNLLRLQIAH